MWQGSLLNALADRRTALRTFFAWGAAGAAVATGVAACGGRPGGPAGGEAGGGAAPGAAPAGALPEINFGNPAENLKAFVKLTGDLDPTVSTVGWFGGDIFAVLGPDKPLVKLVGVEGFGVLRVATQPDGSYRLFNRELAYYKDPKTGEFIDSWTNPFTNETVAVAPIHNKTVNAEIAPVMKMDFDGTSVEVPFSPPWTVLGGKAFSLFEVHTAFPNPMKPDVWPRESAGPVTRISEIFQRTTTLAELADPGRTNADYAGTWTRIGPWLPWMLQGQAPGHILYRTFMDRTGTADRLPKALRERAEKLHPDFFEAPADSTWGGPNDSSFSTYMAENTPKK